MFFAPWSALCLPLTASSCWLIVMLNPATLFCSSASATPLAVGTPLGASPPVIGSSIPSLIGVPPAAAPPLEVDVPLHAVTMMATAPTAAPTRTNFMYASSYALAAESFRLGDRGPSHGGSA